MATIDRPAQEEVSTLTPNSTVNNGVEEFSRKHKLVNCDSFITTTCKERNGSTRSVKRR